MPSENNMKAHIRTSLRRNAVSYGHVSLMICFSTELLSPNEHADSDQTAHMRNEI